MLNDKEFVEEVKAYILLFYKDITEIPIDKMIFTFPALTPMILMYRSRINNSLRVATIIVSMIDETINDVFSIQETIDKVFREASDKVN